jgi:hypothetical protein
LTTTRSINHSTDYQAQVLTIARGYAAQAAPTDTADTQWRHGPPVPAGQPLQPGDLLFYGTPARSTHVTLYVGGGQVIHAPQPGDHVRTAAMWNTGLLGVTRPAAHDLTAPHGANRCSYTPSV